MIEGWVYVLITAVLMFASYRLGYGAGIRSRPIQQPPGSQYRPSIDSDFEIAPNGNFQFSGLRKIHFPHCQCPECSERKRGFIRRKPI